MSANLDKSLGEIISSRKTTSRGRQGRRGAARAPVGGIAKNVAKPRAAAKAAPAPVSGAALKANKKIMVSGLPSDVTEDQIKEYFGTRVGPVSRVELNYDSNRRSRGIATIIFRGDHAQKAVTENNGVKVDGKPMKVEIVYDAKHLAPVKGLGERVTEPKKETKAAAKKEGPKRVKADAKGAGATKVQRGGRGGRAGRPKKKTQDELDAEMVDYFKPGEGDGAASAAPAAAAPAPAGEAMDEVL